MLLRFVKDCGCSGNGYIMFGLPENTWVRNSDGEHVCNFTIRCPQCKKSWKGELLPTPPEDVKGEQDETG